MEARSVGALADVVVLGAVAWVLDYLGRGDADKLAVYLQLVVVAGSDVVVQFWGLP